VVDAYAGIGTIAFWVARGAKEVLGIEERPEAVKDAKENATLNKMTNVKMEVGLVEKLFPKKAEVAILDPPRGGCAEKTLERVVKAAPRLIIYVSCNPESLARDLKVLVREGGYGIERVQPIDMFPQTEHVEIAVKLKRSS
jgi:23S rRNA (uracil1939-C5)-methyltransferase